MGGPVEQALEGPRVDDALGGDAGEPRVRDGDLGVAPLADGVRVGVEREEAARGGAARARS